MRFADVYKLANANLWRTKLRTALTMLGVVIGIGALVSMVSFGVGMQKNVTDELRRHELFTTLQVTPAELDLEGMMRGDVSSMREPRRPGAALLDDDAVAAIRAVRGVRIAFPEVRIPATLRLSGREAAVNVQAVPASVGDYAPFDEIPVGRFFEEEDEKSIILSRGVLRELGFRLDDATDPPTAAGPGDDAGVAVVPADSILGRAVTLVTSVLDQERLMHAASAGELPVGEAETSLEIVGVRGRPSGFAIGRFASGALVPSGTAASIPRLDFTSVWDLLRSRGQEPEYHLVHVRATSMEELHVVKDAIERMGFSAMAIADELEDFRKQFMILDALLGAVGTIALFVASLGIVNTMVTSILERTREIGVMKAIGGSEGDIRRIFLVEAGTIGLTGGGLGLLLGWLVTRVANAVVNYHLRPEGFEPANLFHMPVWLLLGALGFSVLVSLLAGVYPAARAARVDPVAALRHD